MGRGAGTDSLASARDLLDRIAGSGGASRLTSVTLRRRLAITGVLVALFVVGLTSAIAHGLAGDSRTAALMVAATAFAGALALALRWGASTTRVAHLAVVALQTTLFFVQLGSGGWEMQGQGWIVVPPLIAVATLGGRAALAYAAIAVMQTAAFAVLGLARIDLGGGVDPEANVLLVAASQALLVMVLVGCASMLLAVHERTERELSEQAERTRAVVTAAPDTIVVVDSRGTILGANPATESLLGYEEAELVGRSLRMLRPPTRRAGNDRRLAEIVETAKPGAVFSGQAIRVLRKDGEERLVDYAASRMAISDRVEVAIVARDVTERVRAMRALAESEARFRAMSEACPLGIALISPEGGVVHVNPTYERIVETPLEELRGDGWQRLLHPDDLPGVLETVGRIHRDGVAAGGFSRNVLPSGREQWISYRCAPIVEDGQLLGYVTTIEDVTAARRTSDELEAARDRAMAADRAKSEFLATMSHEIRTPMNGILGATGLLAETHLDDEQRDLVSMAHGSAEALLSIIDDILDLSRIEAGRLELEPAPVDLFECVDAVISMLTLRAEEKGLVLSASVGAGTPRHVVADEGRLRQVMINLVNNAIKFTDRGHVTLDVALVGERSGVCDIEFSVRDTGPGISESVRDRLFWRFEQGDNSAARRHGGAGLGLAISKQLVDKMRGEIGVESAPGQGSRFWFRVPLPRDTSPKREAGTDATPALRSGIRVLLAEDNGVNRKIAARLLEKLGCIVDTAGDGREAVLKATSRSYDVVFMDCQMPELDGYEATIELRRREAGSTRRIPVIALTANAMKGDRERCLAAGMDDHVPKPVRSENLVTALRRWTSEAPVEA